MKKIIICWAALLLAGNSFAQKTFTLEIIGISKLTGILKLSIFNSDQSYTDKDIYHSFDINPMDEITPVELTLPEGEYLFSIYQDSNGNGALDTVMFGIPKEPVGISNYNGKGIPGNFKKHKVQINKSTTKVLVQLYEL